MLAAAGAGPLLPLSLFCAASQALGGPATPAGVRDHLVRLRGLAVRSAAGTEQEHAGLFHDTLAEYIAARAPEQNRPAHRALVASIRPDHPHTLRTRNNIAFSCGDVPEALRLSQALLPDQERVLGPGHPETLTARNNIAAWTGECGDAREALRLFEALLPAQQRVLGPDHPDTLRTRELIARFSSG